MELLHTSPKKITKIDRNGRFGQFLFFAVDAYVMSAGEVVTYRIDVDEASIIEAGSLFYHEDAAKLSPMIAKVVRQFGVSEDDAEALLSEESSIFDVESSLEAEDLADASWDIQLMTAECAKALGFRGVHVQDEQGSSYMIDMLGHEDEIEEVAA